MGEDQKSADKRVERSKAAVLAETYRQLSQSGISGLSIDEVSRLSGVAKTTIYRHWPSRAALVIDACSRLDVASKIPDTGSLRGDVRGVATCLAEQLRTCSWTSIYPSIIDAAERDPDVAIMQSELHTYLMQSFRTILARAKDTGEMPLDKSADELIAAIVGPLFYRRWFSKEMIDDHFVELLVEAAFR